MQCLLKKKFQTLAALGQRGELNVDFKELSVSLTALSSTTTKESVCLAMFRETVNRNDYQNKCLKSIALNP